MEKVEVKIKKIHQDAKTPTIGYKGDACWDIYSIEDKIVPARGMAEINVGLATEIPEGWENQLRTRSSFAKKGLQCHFGTVDSGYRGYLGVFMYNHTDTDYQIIKGDKIAQVATRRVPEVTLTIVDELSESERGEKGFGSSGK